VNLLLDLVGDATLVAEAAVDDPAVLALDRFAGRRLHGVALPYATVTAAMGEDGPVRTMVAPGAFQRSITQRGNRGLVPLLRDHDRHQVIGRVLDWTDGPERLDVIAGLTDTGPGRDALELVRAEAVTGFSVGFEVLESAPIADDVTGPAGALQIIEGRLRELSLVPFPAWDDARVFTVATAPDPAELEEPGPTPTLDVARRRLAIARLRAERIYR
jgi:HK97 family phage prohead protease